MSRKELKDGLVLKVGASNDHQYTSYAMLINADSTFLLMDAIDVAHFYMELRKFERYAAIDEWSPPEVYDTEFVFENYNKDWNIVDMSRGKKIGPMQIRLFDESSGVSSDRILISDENIRALLNLERAINDKLMEHANL